MKVRPNIVACSVLVVGVALAQSCAPRPHFEDVNGDGTTDCFDDDSGIKPNTECTSGLEGLFGVCATGTWQCSGAERECVANVKNPPPEERESKCNYLDDDCDGLVDERCPCTPGEVRDCGTGICEMTDACTDAGEWGGCPAPTVEICNGLDDNCDGFTDEDYPEKAQPECQDSSKFGRCSTGVWKCETGVLNCITPTPIAELCNGTDDDCDGSADEDFPLGQPCDDGKKGVCKGTGQYACDGLGGYTCVITSPGSAPSPEICDGLDNNCDDIKDNTGVSDTCDGIDNDCDTIIDNTPVGTPGHNTTGSSCQVCIQLPDAPIILFPLTLTAGDDNFAGNGPWVDVDVIMSCAGNSLTIHSCVTMTEKQPSGNWTVGDYCTDIVLPQPYNISCQQTAFSVSNYDCSAPGWHTFGGGMSPYVDYVDCACNNDGADICSQNLGACDDCCAGCRVHMVANAPCYQATRVP